MNSKLKVFGCFGCKNILWTDFNPPRPISHYCEVCGKETEWLEIQVPKPHHDCVECREKCNTPCIDGYEFRCFKRWKNVVAVPEGEVSGENVAKETGTGNTGNENPQGTQGTNL